MDKRQILKMIFSVVLPPVMVIVLFAVAIRAVIIPATEDALMQKKQDMIQAIVISAISIMDKHAQMEKQGLATLEEAQNAALSEMRALRYGAGNKDYLWITDVKPVMLMHPYFPELEGKLLDKYTDSKGKLFFAEAAKIAETNGDGYVEYMWPPADSSSVAVPKLSYIKLFKQWGWVVGSGIYLDDVEREIKAVTYRLLSISTWIGIIVLLILLFIIRRSWKNEAGKRLAEKELLRSRERYQALAHASGEILFFTIDGIIAGANKKACELLEMNEDEIMTLRFENLLYEPKTLDMFDREEYSSGIPIEVLLKSRTSPVRVLLSVEKAVIHESQALMYTGYLPPLQGISDNGIPFKEALSRSGFGTIILENVVSGKVIYAEMNGLINFSKEEISTSLIGKDIRSFLETEASAQLFLQLKMERKAENMLVKMKTTSDSGKFIRIWASVLENEIDSKGQVAILFADASEAAKANAAQHALVESFLSPERWIGPEGMFSEGMFPEGVSADVLNIDSYLKTKIALSQSVRMGIHAERIVAINGRYIDKIFCKAVQKAINDLGQPPCRYSFLSFGSIGRSEPTLNPDQDTAIIFEDILENPNALEYFRLLGSKVTALCKNAGIPPCNKENTAGNPSWCMNETEWKKLFSSWINKSQPDDLIKVNIFFDFRTVAGDKTLEISLRKFIFQEVSRRPAFLFNLAQDTLSYRTPSDLLGHIRSDGQSGNYINIKGTMLHFVNFTRIYALKYAIDETNTLERLRALGRNGYLPADAIADTIDAWKYLMNFRLTNQVKAAENNFPLENTIMLDGLGTWEEMMLKRATAQVGNLQKRLNLDIVRIG